MQHLILSIFIILFFPSTAWSAFVVVRDHVFVNLNTGTSTFTVEFSEAPDFFTVDEYNRQANDFQYYIYGDQSLSYPEHYASIIRGGELYSSVNTLRIREATPSSLDIKAGGWGEVISEVPWVLNGSTISFTVDTSLLTSFFTKDGVFKYDLQTDEFGGMSSYVSGRFASLSPSPVPLPPSILLFITGLISLASFKWLTCRSSGTVAIARAP